MKRIIEHVKQNIEQLDEIEALCYKIFIGFAIAFVIVFIWTVSEFLYYDKVSKYAKELVLSADKIYQNRNISELNVDDLNCDNITDNKIKYKSCNISFKDEHAYLNIEINKFYFQYRYNCYGNADDFKCDRIDKIKESIDANQPK